MSYIMHNKRLNCIDFIKRFLRENKKVTKEKMKVEIMKRFSFSASTADRYISDIVLMGIARLNSEHLVYVNIDTEEEKRGETK